LQRLELHDQPTELTELEVQELVRWKSTVLDALAGATEGGLPIDDAGVIAEKLSQCVARNILFPALLPITHSADDRQTDRAGRRAFAANCPLLLLSR
jgi:hypothetical protein